MSASVGDEHRTTLRWDGERLVPGDPAVADVLVADSWLVEDATVLAFDLHVRRFVASVAAQGGDARAAEDAIRSLPSRVPSMGRWFPRIDLVGESIVAHVRPAPPRSRRVVLVTADHDPRTTPRIKGPDLAASLDARAAAEARGANEAVLLAGGAVVDGTTSALLWWRGDTLYAPPPTLDRVDSVTARAARGVAAALGTRIDHELATPRELAGAEVWALSALHGIRGVERWLDGPAIARPVRADAWHARLEALRRPWA